MRRSLRKLDTSVPDLDVISRGVWLLCLSSFFLQMRARGRAVRCFVLRGLSFLSPRCKAEWARWSSAGHRGRHWRTRAVTYRSVPGTILSPLDPCNNWGLTKQSVLSVSRPLRRAFLCCRGVSIRSVPFCMLQRSDQQPPCAQAAAPSCLYGSSPEEPHISLLRRCRRLSLGSSRPSLRSQTRFSGLPVLCLREHAHTSSAPLRLLCLPAGSIGSSRLSPSRTSAPYWGAGRGRNPCCRKRWGFNSFPFPARFGGEGETQGPTSLYSAMPLLRHTGVAIYASCAQKRAIHLLLTWSLCTFSLSLSLACRKTGKT